MSLHTDSQKQQPPLEPATVSTVTPKSALKPVIMIGAVLLAVAAVITVLLISTQSKKEQRYAYIKDGSLYVSANGAKGEPITLSGLASKIRFNESKDRIFWVNGSSLFYADIKDDGYKYEKIADNADEDYVIDLSGNTALYMTNDKYLYRYSVADGESEKIGANVYYYENSPNLSRVAFISESNELYIKNGSDEVTKIVGSDDTLRWYGNDDLDTIVYLDETTLCKWELLSGKSETIDTNVTGIAPVCFDQNKVRTFYSKANNTEVKYADYVNDDLADSDAAMQEPIKPAQPTNPSDDKEAAEYEKAYNKYLKDNVKYSEKLSRDALRKELRETDYSFYSDDLYFYNGDSSEKSVTKLLYRALQSQKQLPYPAVLFLRHEDKPATSAKMNMSDIGSIYEVGAFISENYNDTLTIDNIELYFASEKTVTELFPDKEIAYCEMASDGSAIYCFAEDNTQKNGLSLYKSVLSNGTIAETKKIADGLKDRFLLEIDGNKAVYFKYPNGEEAEYEVYVDGEQLDNGVVLGATGIVADKDNIYYFTDYDGKSGTGTLKCRKPGGDTQVISENASQFQVYDDGSVLFIKGRTKADTGELYLYTNAGIIKIDDNVGGIAENYSEPQYGKYAELYRDE